MLTPAILKDLLSSPKKIFITTHRKPDGDALGSSLGLYFYLLKKGHEPIVVAPTDYPTFLHWMPGNDSVIIWDEEKEKSRKYLAEADLIFCLDFNALSRVESMGDEIRKTTTPKIMIDHHLEPEGFEDYGMWNPYACATAELIYDFIEMNDDVDLIDRNIASCLYTGLITDSGSFKFSNVTAKVHRITARLMEAGIDHTDIHQKVFDSMTENRLRFFGLCMKDKLVVLPEFRAAYISITKEEIRKYNIQTGDTEGLVNFPMGLDSVILSAVIVDRDKEVKLSIRSKGSFPANEMAKKYFKGGGHLNAAGGSSDVSLGETVTTFLRALEEYKGLLLAS